MIQRGERGVHPQPAGGDAQRIADDRHPRKQQHRGCRSAARARGLSAACACGSTRPMRYDERPPSVLPTVATAIAVQRELRVQPEHAEEHRFRSAGKQRRGEKAAREQCPQARSRRPSEAVRMVKSAFFHRPCRPPVHVSGRMINSAVVSPQAAQRRRLPPMAESTLITEEYRKMQQELHRNPNYGVASLAVRAARRASHEGDGRSRAPRLRRGQGPARPDARRDVRGAADDPSLRAGDSRMVEAARAVPARRVHRRARAHRAATCSTTCSTICKRVTAGVGVFTVHTGPAGEGPARRPQRASHPAAAVVVAAEVPRALRARDVQPHAAMGFYVIVERKTALERVGAPLAPSVSLRIASALNKEMS